MKNAFSRFLCSLAFISTASSAMAMYPCIPYPGNYVTCLPSAGLKLTGSQVINFSDGTTQSTAATGASGTPNTVATFDGSGALLGSLLPVANGYIAQEGTYPLFGFLFSESGTDTGFVSPSDGVIYQYGNASIGSKWESIGITEMRGVPIFFPTVQGASGSVLTNAGDGNLSWSAIPSPALPQNLTESFDPANTSSTRYNIQSSISPVADSSATNINELQVYTDNFAAFPISGTTSINVGNQNLGSANVDYNHILNAGQTIGNGTDILVAGEVRGALINGHVQNAGRADSVIGYEYSLQSDSGASVGNYQGSKQSGNIDHITGSTETNLAQLNIATSDGYVHSFTAGNNIDLANDNVVAFNDQTNVSDMPPRNTGYTSINIGPSVTTSGTSVGGFTEFSAHSNIQGHVLNDFNMLEGGQSINAIDRNLNYVNLHPNVTSVGGNANGYNDSTHITTVSNGSYAGLTVNPQIDSLAFNYVGAGINARATEATLAAFDFTVIPVDDVAGSLAGKSFNIGQAYADGGNTYTPWYKVSGSGSAPGCCGNPIEVDISTGDTAATIATATVAALNAFGAPFGTTITATDLGGSFSVVSSTQGAANPFNPQDSGFSATYTTHGAGGGTVTGLQINMTAATGFSGVPKAIDSNGGTITAQLNTPIAFEANAATLHNIGTNFGAPASSTITQADQIGFGTPSFVNVGNGSTITSGGFGVGTVAAGGFVLNQIGTGSTIQDVSAAFYAVLPIPGGPDGGVITNGHGVQIAGLPGSATGSGTTFTNFKAFDARAPAGNPATGHSWGLWSDPNFDQNYMGGNLKIGSSGGDVATSPLTVAGTIETTSGGIKFPDATVQTTAFVPPTGTAYSTAVYDSGGSLVSSFDLTDSAGIKSVETDARILNINVPDGDGNHDVPTADYELGYLYHVDLGLPTTPQNPSIRWIESYLDDTAGVHSLGWEARTLYNSAGAGVASWAGGGFVITNNIRVNAAAGPTVTVNANAGTGATCATVGGNDATGDLTLTTTGVAPGAGVQCEVAFNQAYDSGAFCVFSPTNDVAALNAVTQGVSIVQVSNTGFTMNFANPDVVGQTYTWNYHCLGN